MPCPEGVDCSDNDCEKCGRYKPTPIRDRIRELEAEKKEATDWAVRKACDKAIAELRWVLKIQKA